MADMKRPRMNPVVLQMRHPADRKPRPSADHCQCFTAIRSRPKLTRSGLASRRSSGLQRSPAPLDRPTSPRPPCARWRRPHQAPSRCVRFCLGQLPVRPRRKPHPDSGCTCGMTPASGRRRRPGRSPRIDRLRTHLFGIASVALRRRKYRNGLCRSDTHHHSQQRETPRLRERAIRQTSSLEYPPETHMYTMMLHQDKTRAGERAPRGGVRGASSSGATAGRGGTPYHGKSLARFAALHRRGGFDEHPTQPPRCPQPRSRDCRAARHRVHLPPAGAVAPSAHGGAPNRPSACQPGPGRARLRSLRLSAVACSAHRTGSQQRRAAARRRRSDGRRFDRCECARRGEPGGGGCSRYAALLSNGFNNQRQWPGRKIGAC